MLGKYDRFDDIDRYVKGEMSDKECEAFESELKHDEELRARLHVVQDVKEGLQRRAEKLEQINRWREDAARKQQKRPRRFIMTGISAAAAVALVVTLSLPRSGDISQQDMVLPSYSLPSRGEGGPDIDMNGYWEAGKYEECMAAIDKEIAEYQDAVRKLNEEYEQGLCPEEEYKNVLVSYEIDVDYLNWVKVLTLCEMGRYDDARIELDTYLEAGMKYYLDEASELYDKLKR
jgi:hypothetical protein